VPPEHVAATVGDLLEDDRGPVWFWSSVARTVAAFVWRSGRTDGVRIALWASVEWGVVAATLLFMSALWDIPGLLSDHGYRELPTRLWHSIPSYWSSGATFMLWILWFPTVGTPSRGRELPTQLVAGLVWILLSMITRVPTDGIGVGAVIFYLYIWTRWHFRARKERRLT